VALGLLLAWRDAAAPAAAMRFERAHAAPANATVTDLPYREVHAAAFLEDHLDAALSTGNSTDGLRGRVQLLQETLEDLTGSAGPEWWVRWQGVLVRITLEGTP
jgi:hypothetical protein